jgi:hypothetical protein
LQEFENASAWRDSGNGDPAEHLIQLALRSPADGNSKLLQLLDPLELLFFAFFRDYFFFFLK